MNICVPSRMEAEKLAHYMELPLSNFRITGLGAVQTALSISDLLHQEPQQLIILAGIAGAYPSAGLTLSQVVEVHKVAASPRIELADGRQVSIWEEPWAELASYQLPDGSLCNNKTYTELEQVVSNCIQMASGRETTIAQQSLWNAQIEDMESLGLFQTCLSAKQEFLHLRAISNMVQSRDQSKWQVDAALQALAAVLADLLV